LLVWPDGEEEEQSLDRDHESLPEGDDMRPQLAAAVVAGSIAYGSAQAQFSATLTWHWKNMVTSDQTPLHPGQSAAVWMDVSFSPPVGSLLPNGHENRGLASLFFDLLAVSDVLGSWVVTGTEPAAFPGTPETSGPGTNVPMGWQQGDPVVPLHWGRRVDALHPGSGWSLGGDANYVAHGSVFPPTGSLVAIQAGQFPTTTQTNTINPIHEIWRGMFTPAHYAARDLVWQPARASHGGVTLFSLAPGAANLSVFSVGAANINPGSLSVPVVPTPSGMALLGAAAGVAVRRRRG
jgi:MYXO-CTERM domain-containing protein